jgi:hypothetical protein
MADGHKLDIAELRKEAAELRAWAHNLREQLLERRTRWGAEYDALQKRARRCGGLWNGYDSPRWSRRGRYRDVAIRCPRCGHLRRVLPYIRVRRVKVGLSRQREET